jgi:hypothetical protein
MAYCFYQQAGIVVRELPVFTHDDWIGIQYRIVEHSMDTIVELDGRLSGALADDEMATYLGKVTQDDGRLFYAEA